MITKPKLLYLAVGLVLFSSTLACGAVGVYDPQATQAAMAETVVALQGTISALESRLDQPESEPLAQAVTGTPEPTTAPAPAANSTVVAASSLEQSLDLTPTLTPVTLQPQDKTVILVATLTPTPTPERYINPPVLTEPRSGAVVEQGREILLRWSWNGLLRPGEQYDLKIRPDGQNRSAYVAWERGQAHDLAANLAPGRYYWSVQIVRGYYQNDSGEPEDRIFEAFLSPESEPRLLIVAAPDDDDDDDEPTPTPTADADDSDEEMPEATPTPTADQGDDDPDPPDEESEEVPD